MNVQDLGAIGEFISSIAIVITLIFLTMETRQARNATQQSNRQSRHRIRTDINLAAVGSPELCEIVAKSAAYLGFDNSDFGRELGLSMAETSQLYSFFISMLRHSEDQYFSDLPETDRLATENQLRAFQNLPFYPKLWELTKQQFQNPFQEYADTLMREGIVGND